MKVSELINALKGHEDKRVSVAFLMEKDGKPELAAGPFSVVNTGDCEISFIPAVFMEQEAVKEKGLTRAMLERLIPMAHLDRMKKIAESVNDLVRYMEERNLMADVNIKSGQKNDERYFAYAIQAYHMGVLK